MGRRRGLTGARTGPAAAWSDPKRPAVLEKALLEIPVLELKPGFWELAGPLRARVIATGHKARLADSLIA